MIHAEIVWLEQMLRNDRKNVAGECTNRKEGKQKSRLLFRGISFLAIAINCPVAKFHNTVIANPVHHLSGRDEAISSIRVVSFQEIASPATRLPDGQEAGSQ
ncbi:MAG: hypothetical protein HY960_05140 [Ignavibacteriae bacterium]|nr:hypothetical protein [Ignavibacteriota bacterium]